MSLSQGCQADQNDRIIGVKIYDHQGSFDELFSEWDDLGINTVFSSPDLLSSNDYWDLARQNRMTTFPGGCLLVMGGP